jgi:hypothetical protein
VNVLFDNCTAPLFAAPLDAFIADFRHRAFHIKDVQALPKGRDSTDLEWIEYLRRDPGDWIFVSGDGRLVRNPAIRAALQSSGLHGFILSPAYQKTPLHQVAATILWKWPEMEDITRLLAPPSMHEIPIGRIKKLRPLPL